MQALCPEGIRCCCRSRLAQNGGQCVMQRRLQFDVTFVVPTQFQPPSMRESGLLFAHCRPIRFAFVGTVWLQSARRAVRLETVARQMLREMFSGIVSAHPAALPGNAPGHAPGNLPGNQTPVPGNLREIFCFRSQYKHFLNPETDFLNTFPQHDFSHAFFLAK